MGLIQLTIYFREKPNRSNCVRSMNLSNHASKILSRFILKEKTITGATNSNVGTVATASAGEIFSKLKSDFKS
jgi:hypothetical protein